MNSDFWLDIARGGAVTLMTLVGLGCGDAPQEIPRASVQGTVTLDGAPLNEGVVRFVPAEGTQGPKTTVTVTAGKFVIPEEAGPVIGTHRVEIESTDTGGLARDDEQAIERLQAEGRRRINVVKIPATYNTRSRLKAEVGAEGPNEFDFQLTTNARRAR